MLPIKYVSSGRSHQSNLSPVYSLFPSIFPSLVIISVKIIDSFLSYVGRYPSKGNWQYFLSYVGRYPSKGNWQYFLSYVGRYPSKGNWQFFLSYVGRYPSKGNWQYFLSYIGRYPSKGNWQFFFLSSVGHYPSKGNRQFVPPQHYISVCCLVGIWSLSFAFIVASQICVWLYSWAWFSQHSNWSKSVYLNI